jgi:hypothetical protein
VGECMLCCTPYALYRVGILRGHTSVDMMWNREKEMVERA